MTATGYTGGDPSKLDVDGYTKGDVIAANTTGVLTPIPVGLDGLVLTADSVDAEGVDWQAAGGGSSTPSNTVVTETTFGQASTAGVALPYSRGDHTHGTPAAPSTIAPAITVVTETSFGQASAVGTGVLYARNDHTHGTPAAQTLASLGAATKPYVRLAYKTDGDIALANVGAWTLVLPTLTIPAVVGDYVEMQPLQMLINHDGSTKFLDFAIVVSSVAVRYASSGTVTPQAEGDASLYPSPGGFRTGGAGFGVTVTSGDLSAGNVVFQIAHNGSSGGNAKVYANTTQGFTWRAINYGPVN